MSEEPASGGAGGADAQLSARGVFAGLGLVVAFYLVAGSVSPHLRAAPDAVLGIGLISGVVAALALLVSRRHLAMFCLAVAAVTLVNRWPLTPGGPKLSILLATTNVAIALLFRWAVRRWAAGGRLLDHRRPVTRLLVCALAASVVDAVLVLAGLLAGEALGLLAPDAMPSPAYVLGGRMIAQAVGIVTITPLLLLLVRRRPGSWPLRSWVEVGAWLCLLPALVVAARVGDGRPAVVPVVLPIAVLLAFACLIFAVLRLSALAAAVLTPAFSLAAAVMLSEASGPSPPHAGPRAAVEIAGLVAALSAWTVSSVVTERDAAVQARQAELQRRLRHGEARFAAALAGLLDPVVIAHPVEAADGARDLRLGYVNAAAAAWAAGFEAAGGSRSAARPSSADRLRVPVHASLVPRFLEAYDAAVPLVADDIRIPGHRPGDADRYVDLRAVRLGEDLLVSWRDVSARHAFEEELARLALYDTLTGLANRDLLHDHLRLALDSLGRAPGTLAVLYLDLDKFKDVNDTLGHEAGDAVIRQVGTRLAASLRAPDTAARLAGDEFAVVARVRDDVDAVALAERLFDVVREPITVNSQVVEVRPSIGLTTTSDPNVETDKLLREADLAMYQAKHHGPRPWEVFDGELHERALERFTVQETLRSALRNGWFRLFYQPIIDLVTGRIVSAEALLRLQHPERGLLLPDSFIDVAEDSDLIVPIGEWVLDEAFGQLHRWQEGNRLPAMQISVNVSGRQVRRIDLPEQIFAVAQERGVRLDDVTIEITESVLLDSTDAVLADLRRLTAHGCRLAIDDFGTGYSSLTYLKRFPVSTVKIDKSFVGGLGVDDEDTAIVSAVTSLAHTLDLTAVAEGVETAGQLHALRALGCHLAQGYHLATPMTADRLTQVLEGLPPHD